MTGGWIKLWRRTMDSKVWQDAGLFKLFVQCLLNASMSQRDFVWPGTLMPIKLLPGQFVTGRYSLHREYHGEPKHTQAHPSPRTLWRWLKELEQMKMVSSKIGNKYTIVTICNWSGYQGLVIENQGAVSNNVGLDDQQMTTYKKEEKEEDRRRTPPTPSKGVEIPEVLDCPQFLEQWAEWHAYRKEKRKSLTPRTEKMQLKKLVADAGGDASVACRIIEQSIAQGWAGLFPLREHTKESVEDQVAQELKAAREMDNG